VEILLNSLPALSIQTDPLTPGTAGLPLSGCTTSDTSSGADSNHSHRKAEEDEDGVKPEKIVNSTRDDVDSDVKEHSVDDCEEEEEVIDEMDIKEVSIVVH
jgi:hypothetical protein